MDVDDPALEGLEKRLRVDSIVARQHHELDPMLLEEVTHRGISLLARGECLLRHLPERDVPLACVGGASARRPVGRGRDHVEASVDQVAQVRSLPGHGDADFEGQLMTTRSGPAWPTTSPTTIAPDGTSDGSTTRIMPKPMLNVPYISSSATRPRLRINSKIGGTSQAALWRRAPSPSGRQRGTLPRMPPPVMCAAPFHRMRPRSSRYERCGSSSTWARVWPDPSKDSFSETSSNTLRTRAKPLVCRPLDGRPMSTSPALIRAGSGFLPASTRPMMKPARS